MINDRKIFAVVTAAGSGKRMGKALPKQFLKIEGRTILEQTVEKFMESERVDFVALVTSENWIEYCCELFQKEIQAGSLAVLAGGKERQDSVYNAVRTLKAYGAGADDIVLIHDGVRPYVSDELIERVCDRACTDGAAVPAVPPKDTVRHIEKGTLNRAELLCVQTPQGFRYDIIERAFEEAFRTGFYGTDDASLVENMGERVVPVQGDNRNIKITTPEDLPMEYRIGTGFDVHCLVEGRKLILGGVEIPYEKGLLGHSDADVLIHAVMDALLGAAALGDIGKLFPDSDDRFKGISSLKLLEKVSEELKKRGCSLGNADVTVICQKPKLAGYIDEMRKNIAEVMGAEIGQISIKATTTEKLGFTGRGEGIAAEAVCILNM